MSLRASCQTTQAGIANQEGLPNIVAVGTGYWRNKKPNSQPSGAAYTLSGTGALAGSGSTDENPHTGCFDASLSNNIYGGNNEVMPKSINILIVLYLGRSA